MLRVTELRLYWIIWSFAAVYILYRFSHEGRHRLHQLDQSDFVEGWKFLDRPQDTSDEEWRIIKSAFSNYYIWFLGHILLSLLRGRLFKIYDELPAIVYAFYSLLFVVWNFGIYVGLLYMAVVALCILLCFVNSRSLGYISAFSLLYILHAKNLIFLRNYVWILENDLILLELGFSWLIARMLAVCVDVASANRNSKYFTTAIHIPSILLYCLYLPVFYTGPIMNYDDFRHQFYNKNAHHTYTSIFTWSLQFCKYILYYFTFEFLLHFLYSTSVQFYPEMAEKMDAWTLCGLGYSLSVIFYMKYVIIYGVGGVLAELDHLYFPPPPKCVSRISLNTSMWKYFDRGLYLWITRYLYNPLTGPAMLLHRRLFASFCSFLFMSLWHGMQKSIFLWCFLNFLAVSVEMSTSKFYAKYLCDWRIRNISEDNFLRIKAALGAFTFLHLCLSCMFFLSNWEVGMIFYKRILFTFPVPLLPTLFIMYAKGHVALYVEQWELGKRKKL